MAKSPKWLRTGRIVLYFVVGIVFMIMFFYLGRSVEAMKGIYPYAYLALSILAFIIAVVSIIMENKKADE